MSATLLPPANEVWGKKICLQVCVCPQGGGCLVPEGCQLLGGVWSQWVACSGGSGWGVPTQGCLVETLPNGYCCGRYASYLNTFLFDKSFSLVMTDLANVMDLNDAFKNACGRISPSWSCQVSNNSSKTLVFYKLRPLEFLFLQSSTVRVAFRDMALFLSIIYAHWILCLSCD